MTTQNTFKSFLYLPILLVVEVIWKSIIILPAKIKWWEMISDPVEKYHYQIILKLQIFTFKDNIIQNNINLNKYKRACMYTNNELIKFQSYQQKTKSRK